MKTLWLGLFLFSTQGFANCGISFVNEVSSRAEAPKILNSMRLQKKLVTKKGYTLHSLMDGGETDYSIDIFYTNYPSKKNLSMSFLGPQGSDDFETPNKEIHESVKDLFQKLPRCP